MTNAHRVAQHTGSTPVGPVANPDPSGDSQARDRLHPIEWCIPDSPAQRWLEAHGYREVEWKRFHPGETQGWVKMARVAEACWALAT
jgi:hypothetical protein